VFIGELGLEAPPAGAIAGDDDLALHVDAQALQGGVVLRHAVVDIDQRRGDVALAAVGHIGRQHALGALRGRIARDRRFGERRREWLGAGQRQRFDLRRRVEHAEHLDMRIPAPGLELFEGELGVGLVVRRADLIGLGRHLLEPIADRLRRQALVEPRFQRTLRVGVGGREAQHRRGR
jgi:hypothetical protein